MWSAAVTHSRLPKNPVSSEASHGRFSSHVDHHRSLKSSIPELSEKYWVDRCAVSPKRAISYKFKYINKLLYRKTVFRVPVKVRQRDVTANSICTLKFN